MLYFLTDLLVLGCVNSIMVVGLNLQYGYSGLLNFAFYIYVAIGAYIAAITTMGPSTVPGITYALGWTLPWWVGLILGGIVAAVFGALVFLLTVRRLRSDYLAIVTVAVAFIVWNLIDTYQPLFDGDTGLFNVPQITGSANISTEAYSLIIAALSAACLAVFVWMSRRIFRSPFGRLLRSIREDEQVTAAFGRVAWKPQIAVFTIGSFLAGIAGGLLIFYISAWSPAAFLPLESFILLAALIVGGSGNYWGSLLGAFVLIEGLGEISRYVPSFGNGADVGALRAMVIGLVLILMLRYRPEGIIPERWLKWYRTKGPAAALAGSAAAGSGASIESPAPDTGAAAADRPSLATAEVAAPLPAAPLPAAPLPEVPLAAPRATAAGPPGAVAPGADILLDIRDVVYSYDGARAVAGCSFSIDRGTVTGLIGPNGAGKSTLVEILSGRLAPQSGEVVLDGQSVGGRNPAGMSRLGVARTFQTARVLPHLPVLENVMIAAPAQRGEDPLAALFWPRAWRDQETALRREAVELLGWLGLSSHLDRPAGSLSGGQQRLMEIARALMAHPRLLLMDEPTAGVYPETSQLIARRVREIAATGVTVLLIAHNMAFLSWVADDVVVMAEGRVLTRGSLEQAREHKDVIAAYLGVAASESRGSQASSVGGGE
ncbi:MAG TPA: branched-chain amino acid ABC transporter ATP-binding protein/permease [Streptosporangiaceae bacterium]|nr:branched-chain amino acid ABC transporter ATP-binding protein/permease [Streptosporangiaceae bacterium]